MKLLTIATFAALLGIADADAKSVTEDTPVAKINTVIPNARDDLKLGYRHVRWRGRSRQSLR